MKELIACCGLDCELCEARIATMNNDNELRKKVAKDWSTLNEVEITAAMINCVGCRVDGPKAPFCQSMCPIRLCALSKNLATCGDCKELNTCVKLSMGTGKNKDALNNLKNK